MKKRITLIAIVFIFALGVSVLLYPVLGDLISKATSTATVESYQSAVREIDTTTRDAMLAAAREYNASLPDGIELDPFRGEDSPESLEYLSLLNVEEVMGYMDIPAVDIYLPIFHGVSDEVLQKGVGHLPGSSLPVGGAGTHAVLSAHCGLPNARLFTDLDQLEIGDLFFIHVLEQSLAYRVDLIQVVLPEDIHALDSDPDMDALTLLTCTPYGINSHRLLVRGIRVPPPPDSPAGNPASPADPGPDLSAAPRGFPLWWLGPAAALLLPVLILLLRRRARNTKQPK